jgi:hypothetical protein
VGGAAAVAFFYKSGALGSSTILQPAGSEPMLSFANQNPIYRGPNGVFDNPLYQPSGGGDGGLDPDGTESLLGDMAV